MKSKIKRKLITGVVLLVVILLIIGALFFTRMIGTSTRSVVVAIAKGSGTNLHLGFEPSIVTLVLGVNNTVVWKNEDTDWHTAHSNLPEFDSGLIPSGSSFTHVFERTGTYPYHCDPHPWMTGIVVVKSPGLMVHADFQYHFHSWFLTEIKSTIGACSEDACELRL